MHGNLVGEMKKKQTMNNFMNLHYVRFLESALERVSAAFFSNEIHAEQCIELFTLAKACNK